MEVEPWICFKDSWFGKTLTRTYLDLSLEQSFRRLPAGPLLGF